MLRSVPFLVLLAACSDSSLGRGSGYSGGEAASTEEDGEVSGLTAGAWDDNLNYDLFSAFVEETGQVPGAPAIPEAERDAAHARFGEARGANARLDIALLLDTTGSMGDEHRYLVDELAGIASAIDAFAPDADTRWALVVYRDDGDAYVSRTAADFTREVAELGEVLAEQSADGGGDLPEAVDRGLADTLELDWREDADVARLVFWVADAPPHAEDAPAVDDAFRDASEDDIHLYPVAASGVDTALELTMRSGAQLTGGRYLFLTDDSGLGGTHQEPSIPCYFVTLLADQLVRMTEIELTGVYREPDPDEILRTGGDPSDGRCSLEDGGSATAF